MKKKVSIFMSLILLSPLLAVGCAHYSGDINALTGTSIKDLEKARATGKEKILPLPYNTAFNKVMEILQNNNLTIFQTNSEKGYIVAMGFPEQINTTRVGFFFNSLTDNKTKIVVSSLSDTAVIKAAAMIFGEIETEDIITD